MEILAKPKKNPKDLHRRAISRKGMVKRVQAKVRKSSGQPPDPPDPPDPQDPDDPDPNPDEEEEEEGEKDEEN